MINLSRSREFLDLLVGIELKLRALGWIEVCRQGNTRQVFVKNSRLINWAVSCCEKSLQPEIVAALVDRPAGLNQWWILRQLLPDAALIVLNDKLELIQLAGELPPPPPPLA